MTFEFFQLKMYIYYHVIANSINERFCNHFEFIRYYPLRSTSNMYYFSTKAI